MRYPRDSVNVGSPAADLASCCRTCQETLNCIAGLFVGSRCELTIKTGTTGAKNDMCPNGLASGVPVFGELPGTSTVGVFKGPCHP